MVEDTRLVSLCNKVLLTGNAIFMPIATGLVILGLLLKFGTGFVEKYLQTVFEHFIEDVNFAEQDGLSLEDYDLAAVIATLSLTLLFVGLGSLIVLILGIIGAKLDVFLVSLTYSLLLGLIILIQYVLLLVMCVHRGMVCTLPRIQCVKNPLTLIILVGTIRWIDVNLKTMVLKHLRDSYSGFNGTDTLTQSWNILMITMSCCGVDDYTDFDTSAVWNRRLYQEGWWFTLTTPLLCCNFHKKAPGDFSCAVNPTESTSNYQTGCYEAVWSVIETNKEYVITAWVLIFVLQHAQFCSAIVRSKTVYNKESTGNKTGKKNQARLRNKYRGEKDIDSTMSPEHISSEDRKYVTPGFMGNMFWNNGTGDSRSMPHMADRGQPVSALNQLLQQYFFQSRLGTAADPFIPFNLFSAPSMNSFPSNFDNPLDCLNSLIQQNSAANPIIVQIPASNQRFQQLMSQRPLKSLPESVPDSPHISDRQSEICKCVCETPGSSTEHSNDSYTQT